jgi:hypothetical protein
MKEGEMGRMYSTYGGDEKFVQNFSQKNWTEDATREI